MAAIDSILITADTVGGVFTHAVELATALGERDVRVTLALMGGPLSWSQRHALRKVHRLQVVQRAFRLEWMDDAWDDVDASGRWLLEIERRTKADVVQLSSYAHGALPFGAPTVIVAPSCALSWWEAVTGRAPPASYDRYRAAARAGIADADAVVAPTAVMLRAVTRYYGTPSHPRIIPAAATPRAFRPSSKENVVVTVGKLHDPAKNIAALGAIAGRVDWPIQAAGSSVDLDGAARPIPGLVLLGALGRPEIASLLSRAAIFALPARYESFGLSTLEAALSGCALVLGDIPPLRELWGDAALYAAPEDHDALCRAVNRLIGDAELRASLCLRARARALAYSPERLACSFLSLYEDLASTKARPESSSPSPSQTAMHA